MTTLFSIPSYFEELASTMSQLPVRELENLVRVFLCTYDAGRAVFLFGNGGSAALASHMACDLGKGAAPSCGKRLRVVALTDNVPLLTAWANDTCYENIFSEQLANLIEPGDLAFAISGSGNSPNVIGALEFARRAGAVTAGITGFQGGRMKLLCDVCAVVPCENMQIIEDLHLSISHAIFRALRGEIQKRNPEGRRTMAASAS